MSGDVRNSDQITIEPERITVGERLRRVKAHRVEALRQDIDFQGLLSPITLARRGNDLVLIDGAHRLAALTELRWARIPALVLPESDAAQTRFAEIMANVNREDLTKLERADHLAALKALWEEMNPAARNGGDRRSKAVRAVKEAKAEANNQSAIFALCSEVAEKAGLSRRLFFIATQISKGLTDETKARLRDTWLEDHQAGLQDLAGQTPEMQARICDLLFSDPPQASSVGDAKVLAAGRPLPSTADKLYNTATATWTRMPRATREAFMDARKEEFLAHVRKRG